MVVVFLLLLAEHALGASDPTVPVEFERLIKLGHVEFEFSDPKDSPRQYPGLTTFHFSVQQTFTVQYDEVCRNGARYLIAKPKVTKVTSRVTHRVMLPNRLENDDRWSDPLMRHELDHVAISTDPRPAALVEHLLRNVRQIETPLDGQACPSSRQVFQVANEEFAKRRHAVIHLIQFNYVKLDDVSRHGRRVIPDRKNFFEGLFTKANLDEAGFPYTDDALDLLRSRIYRNLKLLYVTED